MPDDAAAEMEMTKEEKKFLMRALWDSLVARKWTKDDLVDFGKAIFTKVSLKDMPDKTFTKVFPYLNEIVSDLGTKLSAEAERQAEIAMKQVADADQPANVETKTEAEAKTEEIVAP